MDAKIALIVGLGNPGAQYESTRHNAGFWFLDALQSRHGVGSFRAEARFHGLLSKAQLGAHSLWLLKPSTFMNRSGQAISAVRQFYKLESSQILVVHDELDLDPGVARLKRGGGHGGHNGLRDTIGHIGKDFARLRLGIGHPGHRDQVVDYVLQRPSVSDRAAIDASVDAALSVVDRVVMGEWQGAMNDLHSGS